MAAEASAEEKDVASDETSSGEEEEIYTLNDLKSIDDFHRGVLFASGYAKFRELKDRMGVTFLLIEHRLEIALKYTDYVYAMASGMVVSEGKPESVMADPQVIEAYLGG